MHATRSFERLPCRSQCRIQKCVEGGTHFQELNRHPHRQRRIRRGGGMRIHLFGGTQRLHKKGEMLCTHAHVQAREYTAF